MIGWVVIRARCSIAHKPSPRAHKPSRPVRPNTPPSPQTPKHKYDLLLCHVALHLGRTGGGKPKRIKFEIARRRRIRVVEQLEHLTICCRDLRIRHHHITCYPGPLLKNATTPNIPLVSQ